ncbi:hypothetical protein HZA26_01015 [Candidatus Nomurabacteria bacterium]|nr:hypothetical protein [Candidatus Nomurabacteria bacterium]
MSAELYFYKTLPSRKNNTAKPWIYIGKCQYQINRWARCFDEKNRIFLGCKLEQTALKLREPFTEWISKLAQNSHKDINAIGRFWAITFTARSPETSDIFQNFCLLYLCISEMSNNPEIQVVVEDPWLFSALLSYVSKSNGNFQARLDRFKVSVYLYARVLPARFLFLLRGTSRLILAHILRPRNSFNAKTVNLVSYAIHSSLTGNTYHDSFFGNLPELLKSWNLEVHHLFPLHTPSKLFFRISRIPSGRLLASWATALDLLYSSLFWAKISIKTKAIQFENINIKCFLQKELIKENASNRYVLNIWQTLTWKRFSKHAKGVVIYIFENHPWEKGLNYSLSKSSVNRIGYQHSTIPALLMNYIPAGKAEVPFYPEVILANSPANEKLLKSFGWDIPKVLVAGALRYNLRLDQTSKIEISTGVNRRPTLYIAFPGEPELSDHLLNILNNKIHADSQTRLLLKFHPSLLPRKKLYKYIPRAELANQQLNDLANQLDGVLFVSTTLGLEAMLIGLPVYRFIPDSILSLDPMPSFLSNHTTNFCDYRTIGRLVSNITIRKTSLQPRTESKNLLYFPVDDQVWKKTLRIFV